jgi:putative two-component system response regulator
VIFVTAMDGDSDEAVGLGLGAVDYITKPVRPAILLARVHAQLELKRARDLLRDQNGTLEREVARRMRENETVKEVSLHALALLAELRDNETGNHLYRTRDYVDALCRQLRHHPRFAAQLSGQTCHMIARAAPLHDIGKVGIPDAILRKPGPLTPEEFEIMKTHAAHGGAAIAAALARVGPVDVEPGARHESSEALAFLEIARQIARWHHEHWDGSGYPDGLTGEAIPLPARLMALADVYDALSFDRVYKPAFLRPKVERDILAARGTQFDPDVVDAFAALRDEFHAIAVRYADAQSPQPEGAAGSAAKEAH